MREKRKILLWVVLLVLSVGQSMADVIILDNGHRIVGCIINEREDKLQMETFSGIMTIENKRIKEKMYASPHQNELIRAEMLLNDEEWQSGFSRYLKLLEDEGTSVGEVMRSICAQREKILKGIPQLKGVEKEGLRRVLENLLKSRSEDREFNFFSGQVYFELGEREEALEILSRIPAEFYEGEPQRREFVGLLFQRIIEELIKGGEFTRVLEKIERLSSLNKNLGKACEIRLYLQWGANLREKGDYAEALKIYSQKLLPLSSAIALNRINYTLNKLIEEAKKKREFDEAIRLLETYGNKYLQGEYEQRLTEILLAYGNYKMEERRYDEARRAFERYYQYQPMEGEKRLLNLCTYKEQGERLTDAAYAGHYELGKFCLEHSLLDEAVKEFEQAAKGENFKENALIQIRLIKERQELEMFNRALKLYETASYVQALDILEEIRQKFPAGSLKADVDKLSRLSQDGLKDEAWRRPFQAEVYYQQAERLYYLNDYNSALDKLNSILELYPETPAAEKTRELQSRIAQLVRIASLEGAPLNIDKKKLPTASIQGEEKKKELEQEIKSLLKDFNKD